MAVVLCVSTLRYSRLSRIFESLRGDRNITASSTVKICEVAQTKEEPIVLKNIRADGMRRELVACSSITNRKVMKKLRLKLKQLFKAPRWKCLSVSYQKYDC